MSVFNKTIVESSYHKLRHLSLLIETEINPSKISAI